MGVLSHFHSDFVSLIVLKVILLLVSNNVFALIVFDLFYLLEGTPRPEGVCTRWITLLIRRVLINIFELFTLIAISTCMRVLDMRNNIANSVC